MLSKEKLVLFLIVLYLLILNLEVNAQEIDMLLPISINEGTSLESSVTGRIITNDKKFKKIIVVVEPFDANHNTSDEFTHDSILAILNSTQVGPMWLSQGYTIVIVELEDNWASLKLQAFALGELLDHLQRLHIWHNNGLIEPIKVISFSMGGIVGTIACGIREYYDDPNSKYSPAAWERSYLDGWIFKVNLLLTWDTPHSGAVMPSSIFSFVYFWRLFEEGNMSNQAYKALTSISASQMLIYPPFNLDHRELASSWKIFYQDLLDVLFNHKWNGTKSFRFVGIVNGCWRYIPQYEGEEHVKTIDFKYVWGLWDYVRCYSKLYSHAPDGQWVQTFWAKFFKGWGSTPDGEMTTKSRKSVNYENGPGGFRPTYKVIWDGIKEIYEKEDGTIVRLDTTRSSHNFVPTFSAAALDIKTFGYRYFWDLLDFEQKCGSVLNYSPMDRICHQTGQGQQNQEHVKGMNTQNITWLINEVKRATILNNQTSIYSRNQLDLKIVKR